MVKLIIIFVKNIQKLYLVKILIIFGKNIAWNPMQLVWHGVVCPERWEGVTHTWTEEAYNVLGHRN